MKRSRGGGGEQGMKQDRILIPQILHPRLKKLIVNIPCLLEIIITVLGRLRKN